MLIVISLITNIPLYDILNKIKDYDKNAVLRYNNAFTRKILTPQDNFLDLAPQVLTTM